VFESQRAPYRLCYHPAKRSSLKIKKDCAMETNLRPLSLGEILDRTAQLYRTNFLLFAGIASVYAGVLLVLALLEIGAEELLRAMHQADKIVLLNGLFILAVYVVLFLVGGIAVAATTRAVAWLNMGEPATIRGAYASVLPRFGRYLWLQFLKAFFAWGPLIGLYVLMLGALLFAGLGGTIFHPGTAPTVGEPKSTVAMFVAIGGGLLCFVLILLSVPYGIIMALRYALAVPACVVENLTARQAIKRSIVLSSESRGRIFILYLLVFVLQMGLILVSQIFFIWAAFKNHFVLPPGLRALQQIVSFFTSSFVFPILATGITLFYYDQRIRKEGYDIEWMMQAAGLAAPAPVAASLQAFDTQVDAPTVPLSDAVPDAVPDAQEDQGAAHE
jgi:hypothetical protein